MVDFRDVNLDAFDLIGIKMMFFKAVTACYLFVTFEFLQFAQTKMRYNSK